MHLTAARGSEVCIISRRGDDVLGQILKKHYETEGMTFDNGVNGKGRQQSEVSKK